MNHAALRYLRRVMRPVFTSLLMLTAARAYAQPANNLCANATSIGDGIFAGTTVGATNEGASSACNFGTATDVWYSYLAPLTGQVTATTCGGATWDTVLDVWDNCPANGGVVIACNDQAICGNQSTVQAQIHQGNTYLIRVSGWNGAAGAFTLNVSSNVTPPLSSGPDVILAGIAGVSHYGPVGGIHAYAIGSETCNMGDTNLHWGGTYGGSPSLAMNAYRLFDGRLLQIGQGFVKRACCAAAGTGCGISCNGQGGSVLGTGCMDVYGSGYNGSQSVLGPRSGINAFSGAHNLGTPASGNEIFRRLQVAQIDMSTALFPNALYFVEGQYIGSDDGPAGNALNNGTYQRVTIDAGYLMTLVGNPSATHFGIEAWHDHGLGIDAPDPAVVISNVDVPSEGRFIVANKVRSLGGGLWRYDYAVYNINSDRSGGFLTIPLPPGANVTNAGFHDVNYHSGEPYDNTDWTLTIAANGLTWASPQTFGQNPNSNALRWGTMYNFWFDADRPPGPANATLGLFKPWMPDRVVFAVSAPVSIRVAGDMNCDGAVDNFDIDPFVLALTNAGAYVVQHPGCNINNADVNNDGARNNFDIDPFVTLLTH